MNYKKTTLGEALREYKNFQHRLNQFLDDFYSSDKTTKEMLLKRTSTNRRYKDAGNS